MRLILCIGWCLLVDLIGAQTWKENPATPLHGQKVGPQHSVLPVTRFECSGRGGGYYGDMDFGCSVFHYCTAEGTRYTFRCSKGLKFNEMTTSCSPGFFGDCTHPEIVGSAGRNMTAEPAPVKSFQNIPIFKGEDNSFEQDPRDYPEPFIQHYDPALDLNYDYYESEDSEPPVQDAQPSASNIQPSSSHFKRESSWDNSMRSALSSFASLVNMPLDGSSDSKARLDRINNHESVDYVNNIDRAFIARPPPRRTLIQRENHGQFVKLQPFKHGPKKTSGINHFPGHRQNQIPVSPPPLYPVPPTERFNNHQDQFNNNAPSSSQYQNIIPYDSEDSYASQEASVRQTTPDTFRPSSLLTDDPDEFQPVTTKSDQELPEHTRPNRQANHQTDHGTFSSSFQSFSPTSRPFSPTRFPSHTSFGESSSSQRGFDSSSGGFLPAPNFPPSGNFVFNQPPIHPTIFNAPFHSVSPQSRPTFGRPQPPSNTGSRFNSNTGPSFSSNTGPSFSSNTGPSFNSNTHPSFSSNTGPSFSSNTGPFNSNTGPSFNSNTGPSFNSNTGPSLNSNTGPSFSSNTGSTFRQPPADHHTPFIHRPAPPPRGHSFGPPPNQQTIFRPQNAKIGPPLLHSNSFHHSPNHRPLTSPTPHTFIHHSTPSSTHTFGNPPIQHTFPPQPLSRPTPAPGFITTTSPSSFDIGNQNPFGFQHERPLLESFPNILQQQTESPVADLSSKFPQELVHQNFPFPITSTNRPFGLSLLNTQETFPTNVEVQKKPQSPLPVRRPLGQGQGNPPPGFDPRPTNRRRRPVASRRPVTLANRNPVTVANRHPVTIASQLPVTVPNQQPITAFNQHPVSFTTRPPLSFSKRPPSRSIRKNIANNVLQNPNPTLLTGLENSPFHSPFLQPDGRHPGSQTLVTESVDSYTTFDDSQLHETESQHSKDIAFNDDFDQHFPDAVKTSTTEKSLVQSSTFPDKVEDSNNIVEYENDYEDIVDTVTTIPTTTQSTTTQTAPTKVRTPILRRRPNIRNRLRTRLTSRTRTTAKPSQSDENTVGDGPENSVDNTKANDSPSTTTLSPFRQRVRNRLNSFKNQNQGTDVPRITTEATPEEDPKDTGKTSKSTTKTPTTLIGQRGINSDRFQSYRKRLTSRNRSRITRTTVKPDTTEDNATQKPANSASLLTRLRSRKTNPANPEESSPDVEAESKDLEGGSTDLNTESTDSEAESTVLEAESTDMEAESTDLKAESTNLKTEFTDLKTESTDLKTEFIDDEPLQATDLDSDQQTEETSQTIIKELPPSLHLPPSEDYVVEDYVADDSAHEEPFVAEVSERESIVGEETNSDYPDITEDSADNGAESSEHVEDKQAVNTNPNRRKIINPNFRARFREFIKNRKNRVSSSYTTTATPDIPNEEKETKVTSTAAPVETSTLSLKERMQQFNKNRQGMRQRFLANRQANDEERLSRRIPLRPLRNKVLDKKTAESSQGSEKTEEVDSPESREASTNLSENDKDLNNQQKLQRNSAIVPLNKVTDGFTPALNPIHFESPLIGHLPVKDVTASVMETEIITAAPPSKVEDPIFTVKVSATLGGESEITSESKKEESISPSNKPMQMIVKEIGLLSDTTKDDTAVSHSQAESVSTEKSISDIEQPSETLEQATKSDFSSDKDDHPSEDIIDNSSLLQTSRQSDGETSPQEPDGGKSLLETKEKEDISDSNAKTSLPETKEESNLPDSAGDSHISEANTDSINDTPDTSETILSQQKENIDANTEDNIEGNTENSKEVSESSPTENKPLETSQNDENTESIQDLNAAREDVKLSPLSFQIPDKTVEVTTADSTPARVSRPSFNLKGTGSMKTDSESSAISASDFSGEFADNATPVSLLPITMSTDPPRLPIEMLLGLFQRR